MIVRKFDENTYKQYGLNIIQVNNGYKVYQKEDGYINLTLYNTKQKAQNFIDNMISFFIKSNTK
ncbi:hypothetical protein D7X33_28245 [Butyricicoccus sp. 1XD8-22]|nr:hypothetical protein D7X33_28245 [Butyricicoccus sp. 1XD8-22]